MLQENVWKIFLYIHSKLIENPIINFQEVYFFLDRGLPTSWSKYGPQGARQKVNELLIYYPLGKMNIHIIFQGILLLRYVDLDQVCSDIKYEKTTGWDHEVLLLAGAQQQN